MQTNGKYKHEKFKVEHVVQAIHDSKGMVTKAAQRLGCAPRTVRNYAQRYSTVAEAIIEEREHVTDIAEMALLDKIQDGDLGAITFYLRTQGRDRGYTERHENIHSGPGGGPIRTEKTDKSVSVDASAVAELTRMLEDLGSAAFYLDDARKN
jgi:hypothetical protein